MSFVVHKNWRRKNSPKEENLEGNLYEEKKVSRERIFTLKIYMLIH
jgi:hypothetical protein